MPTVLYCENAPYAQNRSIVFEQTQEIDLTNNFREDRISLTNLSVLDSCVYPHADICSANHFNNAFPNHEHSLSSVLGSIFYFLGRALENEDYTVAQLLIKLCLTIIDTSHFDSKMETKRLEKL